MYGYAYNIYSIFLSISQAGIPLAMSKIISEYDTLGYLKAKEKAYSLGKKFLFSVGLVCFIILFLFAEKIGYMIIRNNTGGNTVQDVAFVIRAISTAILIIPVLSVTRGYFQGNKFITPTSISQIIEQVVRVSIIVFGSFIMYRVLHLSLKLTVGVAVVAATIGGVASYVYLLYKEKKNKQLLSERTSNIKEPKITNKQIMKKILFYAVPFVMIDLFKSLYNSVDTLTLVNTLANGLGKTMKEAESIMSVISTWGLKLNMIVIAFVSGLMTSLIPNLTASYVQNDMKEVNNKINKTYQIILFFTIPMTIGLSILAKPVWTVFYGVSKYGEPITYKYLVFVALATAIFTSTVTIVQLLKQYKMVFISLISGMAVKVLFNIPFIYGFNTMGLPAQYGAITATILGLLTSSIICMIFLKNKYKINFEPTIKEFINIVIAIICMVIALYGLDKIILLVNVLTKANLFANLTRFNSIIYAGVYAIVGGFVYILVTHLTHTIDNIFGVGSIKNIKNKIFHKNRRKRKNGKK